MLVKDKKRHKLVTEAFGRKEGDWNGSPTVHES